MCENNLPTLLGEAVDVVYDIGKMLLIDLPKERERHERIQNDFISLGEELKAGDAFILLGLYTINVSEEPDDSYALIYESVYTETFINNVNSVTGSEFTVEEFRDNPDIIMRFVANLPSYRLPSDPDLKGEIGAMNARGLE